MISTLAPITAKRNLMLPRPMREFIWTDVMYNPNVERERKGGRHAKKVSGRGRNC